MAAERKQAVREEASSLKAHQQGLGSGDLSTPRPPGLQGLGCVGTQDAQESTTGQTSANGICTDPSTSQLGSQPPEDLTVDPNSIPTMFEVLSSNPKLLILEFCV